MSQVELSRLTLDISKDLKDTLKILAVSNNMSIKQYIIESIIERVQKDESLEDLFLWIIAKEHHQSNEYLWAKESKDFLVSLSQS